MPRGGPRSNKPTSLKVLHGTARPDRINGDEPKPQPIAGDKPASMDYYAEKAWDYLAPKLEKLGVLTEIDGPLFALFCEAYGRWERARRRLQAAMKTGDNDKIRQAEVSVEKAEQSARLLAGEFGIGAAARSRLSVETEQEEDAFEAFLKGNE